MLRKFPLLFALGLLGAAPARSQEAPPPAAILAPAPADAPSGDYGPYLTYAEMQAKVAGWARDYPGLVRVSSLGKTVEGRDIPLVRLSAAKESDNRPEVLLLSGIHPREQQPQMGVAALGDELLAAYGKDDKLTRLLRERVVWVVPVFNVDGKIHDMKHGDGKARGADWRKNRRPNADGSFGVDLNRNFAVRWGGSRQVDPGGWNASTQNPKADIFEGTAPLSEPEDRALADFIASRRGHLRVFLDIHSPLRALYAPTYLIGPEYDRYKKLLDGMQARQQEPYKATVLRRDADPPTGVRGGDSGLTYHWVYYTQGVYAFNFEYGAPKETPSGVRARYAPPEQIESEYARNARGPILHLIEAAGELPAPRTGKATLAAGPGKIDGGALAPGATVSWTPPAINGRCDYAVLVSEGPEIVVPSEYRRAPFANGFTLQVDSKAKPGASVPLTLYLWDRDRNVSAARVTLTVAADTPANTSAPTPTATLAPARLRVAVYRGPGASEGRSDLIQALEKDPTIALSTVSPDDIRAGKLANFDVIVHPGGSGGGQGKALGEEGREQERKFLRAGGGYVGVCGGAYLASADYPWSLHVLNARVIDKQHWARGHGPVDIGTTEKGRTILKPDAERLSILYWQGPLLAPAMEAGLPAYDEWARFETEIADKGAPRGVMVGTTAVAAASYGAGRVVCFSPHPEKTEGLAPLLHRAVAWAAAAKKAAVNPLPRPLPHAVGEGSL
jgi:hypothetical protein